MPTPTPVQSAGIYQMELSRYISDPAPMPSLSTGVAHALLTQSPRHAWVHHPKLNPAYEPEHSSRLDLGTIAHALLLEGDESRVVTVDADDWRTKDAKAQRDEARAKGQLPILKKDYVTVKLMVSVAVDAIYGSELCEDWMAATPEQTLLWQEADGVWCRSRPDKLTTDGRIAFDYKSCAGSAHPAVFGRGVLLSQGYDLQAALALRGIQQLIKPKQTSFVFVCQEIDPPYAVSFVGLSPAFLAIANERLELALHQWGECLATNRWPSYPQRIAYVAPPSFYGMDSLMEES